MGSEMEGKQYCAVVVPQHVAGATVPKPRGLWETWRGNWHSQPASAPQQKSAQATYPMCRVTVTIELFD